MTQLAGQRPAPEYRLVLDALQDPVLASDESHLVTYLNAAATRLLGWSEVELVGRPLTTIVPARFRAAHEGGFQAFLNTGISKLKGRAVRVSALHRDGHELDVELRLSVLEPMAGLTLIVAVFRDLRERVELEQKLASQRKILAQYAAVGVLQQSASQADAMPKLLQATAQALGWHVGLYWELNQASQRLHLSSSWCCDEEMAEGILAAANAVSFAPGEGLPGQSLATQKPVWSSDVRSDPRYLRAQMATTHGLRSALLFPVYCAQRAWGVLEYLSQQSEDPDEDLLQTMAAIGFQIGQFLERVATEQKLRRALDHVQVEKNNLYSLLMQAPAAIAIVRGSDFRYELSNPMNQRLAGGRPLIGKTVREALPELEANGTIAILQQVYETGEPFFANEYAVTLRGIDGQPEAPVFMNAVAQPLRGESGAVEGVMAFAYEVTELVGSRDRVREAEERLRLALEAASVGTFDFDLRTRNIQCDARYRALFGLSETDAISPELLAGAIHPEDHPRMHAAVDKSLDAATGGHFDVSYRIRGIRDGIQRWAYMRGRTLFAEEGKPVRFIGTGIDITAQRRSMDRLEFLATSSTALAGSLELEATLQAIVDLAVPALSDICVVELLDERGTMERRAASAVNKGKSKLLDQLKRAPLVQALAGAAQVVAKADPLLLVSLSKEELWNLARDEAHFLTLQELDVRSLLLLPMLSRGRVMGLLALLHAESGRRYNHEEVAFAEEVARRAAVAIENARLYAQKLEAIAVRDQFLSIASHELKTPLTSITLQLSAFSRLLTSDKLNSLSKEKLEHRLSVMTKQSDRLTALIEELLDVSRFSQGDLPAVLASTDLVELVRDALAGLAEEAARKGMTFEFHGDAQLVGVWDGKRIEQVVVNLVENALKYGPPGRPVRVQVKRVNHRAVLRVQDEGSGIAVEDQKRIFEQFERAASPNLGGLGLGLWIARKIVEAHAGTIYVESRLGAGSTFVVELPLGGEET